jgi:hypothetical protein
MRPRLWLFSLALLVVLVLAGPAAAADQGGSALFGKYWGQFVEYWQGALQKQNGVVLVVLGLGAVALLIITRSGKWNK